MLSLGLSLYTYVSLTLTSVLRSDVMTCVVPCSVAVETVARQVRIKEGLFSVMIAAKQDAGTVRE